MAGLAGIRPSLGDGQATVPQPRRGHLDRCRLDRATAGVEIVEALEHDLRTRELPQINDMWAHAPIVGRRGRTLARRGIRALAAILGRMAPQVAPMAAAGSAMERRGTG
ncbi:MAG: hypothetical protein BroJett022_01090 [Actinomycetes bacterium]|nr:MAG: hypothetical protein BroJett022_01090 [Actinomycetes bacterium]